MDGWLVGLKVGWLRGWLADWLVRLLGLVAWLFSVERPRKSNYSLVGRQVGWLVDTFSVNAFTTQMIRWLVG